METPQQDANFVKQMLGNNAEALRFLNDTMLALAFWDDMGSGAAITPARAQQAMWSMLFELPANRFYRAHFDTLHPIMRLLTLQWIGAAITERDVKASDDALMVAYVDGQSLTTLLLACSMAINGPAIAAKSAAAIRRFGLDGGFAQYLKDIRAKQAPPTKKSRHG